MLRINHNLINKTMESKDQIMFYNTTKEVVDKAKTGKTGKWKKWDSGTTDFVSRPDIDEFITKYCNSEGITIIHKSDNGENVPYYNGNANEVFIPASKTSTSIYYSTILHELSHSTGMIGRLKRPTFFPPLSFMVQGLEEIVAELSAACLCHKFNIGEDSFNNSVAYVKDWIENDDIRYEAVDELMPYAVESANYILEHAK